MKFVVWFMLSLAPLSSYAITGGDSTQISSADSSSKTALTRIYEWSMKPVQQYKEYVAAVRAEGSRRIFVKDNTAEEPASHWWEVFKPTPERKSCLELLSLNHFILQLPVRLVSYLVTGTSYDFLPISLLNEGIENFSLMVLKQKGKQFTVPLRTLLMAATFPITGFGVTAYTTDKVIKDLEVYKNLQFMERFDYRSKDAKDITDYEESTIAHYPDSLAAFKLKYGIRNFQKDSLFLFNLNNIGQERKVLGDFLTFTNSLGFDFTNPLVLGALRGDSVSTLKLANRLAEMNSKNAVEKSMRVGLYQKKAEAVAHLLNQTLLKDAAMYTSDGWLGNAPDFIKVPYGQVITDEQKNNVYRIQLELLQAIDLIYARQSPKSKFLRFIGINDVDLTSTSFLHHLNDSFITETLPDAVWNDQTDDGLLAYHASQYLVWAARLEMMKAMNVTFLASEFVRGADGKMKVHLTSRALTMEEIQREILTDRTNDQSIPNEYRQFQEWKKSFEAGVSQ